jgi:hypothetical protein
MLGLVPGEPFEDRGRFELIGVRLVGEQRRHLE